MANKKIPDFDPMVVAPADDDKFLLWDTSAGKTKQIAANLLPGNSGGGGSSTPVITSPSPFFVFNNSIGYSYDAPTNTVKISDARLKNRANYPVLSTQLGGGEINPEMVGYNPVDPGDDTKGQLTITGFQLDDGAHLSLIVPGDLSSADTSYAQMKADIAMFKLILAPLFTTAFGANRAKVWWLGPASEIPAGWQECVSMRGKFPMAQDPNDPDFSAVSGTPIGAKTHQINTMDKLPKHSFFTVVNESTNNSQFPDMVGRALTAIRSMILSWGKPGSGKESYVLYGSGADNTEPTLSPTNYLGKDVPDSITHINPGIIGLWIEFIGI